MRVGSAGKRFGAPPSAGILLFGKSGSGKSDLALRLIALGAELVSDDRTDLRVARGRLVATAPKSIAGLIEVRGVGIARMAHSARATIALAVELDRKPQRLPEAARYRPLPALAEGPRLIALDAFEASAPLKVLIAAAGRLLR
ncbi:MAG: aldolase [Proteobacteria bacterium]|nr:aldolase [Pseudomonadota bacterium]